MGNGMGTLTYCIGGDELRRSRRRSHDIAMVMSEPYDEGLGHSFCYVRPDPSSKVHHHSSDDSATTFRSISGASVSANTSTALSTTLVADTYSAAAAFDCSTSFSSVALQPVPRVYLNSGPFSGPMERGFMSGPIERIFSGPLSGAGAGERLERSFSHGSYAFHGTPKLQSLIRGLYRKIARKFSSGHGSIIAPIKPPPPPAMAVSSADGSEQSMEEGGISGDAFDNPSLHWAQGKAGEDRVHVVISEEHGWVFVGIYDGFNGPDAPDYLLANLYPSVHRELKGLLWEDKFGSPSPEQESDDHRTVSISLPPLPPAVRKRKKLPKTKWEENQRRWKCEWDRERLELDRKLKEQLARPQSTAANHSEVLKALSTALRKTEEAYLDAADSMVAENPELALMGSCVMVMLMKGDDVYLMNVGDSRAVLGRKAEPDVWGAMERIKEETLKDLEAYEGNQMENLLPPPSLTPLQLTSDHSTCVEEEIRRIKKEHPDDASAVVNDRVKGSLKVTRAFGAGFLKQPKWNDALLEMFRIDYVGTSPYITCNPSLYHHRLDTKDRFLILSSDGLYQYFTNEEAVTEVELFIASFPEGDPAQHLVEEVIFRAAEKAGMDFHELIEIPQGDRRKYHDDVSVIVISLEGRIWRYCV